MELVDADLAVLAAEAGAADILVLRRAEAGRFLLLGGTGRGEAWAGAVEVDVAQEPAALAALASGDVQLVAADVPVRVTGPYWSRHAALVPVDHDVLVVLGGLAAATPDLARLRRVAVRAALEVDCVAPAKRVADDLGVVQAVRRVMAVEPVGVRPTLRAVADIACEALGAALVVCWVRAPGALAASGRLSLPADDDEVALAIAELAEARVEHLAQDATERPLPAPLAAVGPAAWALVPLGDLGALLVVHGRDRARGFTRTCGELGRRLAEAAECVLHAAVVRERLDVALEVLAARAQRDDLTGVGTRAAWEEALAAADGPATVLVLALAIPPADDAVDRHVRSELVRAAAIALRGALRDGDTVARIGPTSFGVLVAGAGAERGTEVAARLHSALVTAPPVFGVALDAHVHRASAPPEPSPAVAGLVAEARAAA